MSNSKCHYGSTSVVESPELFSGSDHSKWPKFQSDVNLALSAKEIETTDDGKVYIPIRMRDYRTHPVKEVLLVLVADLTADDISDGLAVGDYRLQPKNLKTYRDALKHAERKRKHAFQILYSRLVEGSPAQIMARKHIAKSDYDGLMAELKLASRAETLAVLLSFSFANVNLERSVAGKLTAMQINGDLLKNRDDFMSVTKSVVKLDGDTDESFAKRKARGEELFEFCNRYARIQVLAKESDLVNTFVNRSIRENVESLSTVDLKAIDILFEANMNAANTGVVPVEINLTGNTERSQKRKNKKEQKRKLTVLLTEQLKKFQTAAAGTNNEQGSQKKGRTTGLGFSSCNWCGVLGHKLEYCFHNPDRVNKDRPLPVGFVMKPRLVSLNMMNVQTFGTGQSAPELSDFGSANQVSLLLCIATISIILDGGASHNVFNHFNRHLFVEFHAVNPIEITGISGATGLFIEGEGKVILMGETIDASYCPRLAKSVVSDGVLCKSYSFSVFKIGSTCTLTNLKLDHQLTFSLSKLDGQYDMPVSAFQTMEQREIMLASVRPSNPKTLWHGRFGHSHMSGIIRMARLDLYANRGLKIPASFLKTDPEEDLCDACARGKPTISHKYEPHTRSDIKGKLWYFDVSCGGELVPSLVYSNRYLLLFVDSCTRKYFPYYTKNRDDSTIIRILNQHYDEVISFCDLHSEILFFQSDNGELDTTNVKTWMRSKHALQRFTRPYCPSMNGMAERAFRSIKDLALCMMMHAGLPPPYWEKATGHACLILDIQPNQTADGWAREAYFLWTGLIYDYSLLRTWGSRCYATNHTGLKDFGAKSVEGIYVGMKQSMITHEYEMFLPLKNKFIQSGSVTFCEHVGRSEPERLLPPVMTIPRDVRGLLPEHYQNLVDTIHFDNEEGVQYRVLKVYSSKGLVIVDRELYDPRNPDVTNKIDTVNLGDVLSYPILAGVSNPTYRAILPDDVVSGSPPVIDGSLPIGSHQVALSKSQEKKKRKLEATKLQNDNIMRKVKSIGTRQSERLREVEVNSMEETHSWKSMISEIIMDWSMNKDIPFIFHADTVDTLTQPVSHVEPKHHKAAMQSPEAAQWRASEDREVSSLLKNEFAEVVDIPVGRRVLPCMWVYAFKRDHTGRVIVYKSRIVVRGDQAVEGLDYVLTFSPVAKLETIRIACALIILLKMKPLQVDINTAYVQSKLEEDIYMWGIPGYDLPRGKCYKLLRSLYGLPQSGRNWNILFVSYLLGMGFVQIREDLCLLILVIDNVIVAIIALYVDDLLIGTDTDAREQWLLLSLQARFDLRIIGIPSLLLGITMKWSELPNERFFSKVTLSIAKCINALLVQFDMVDCKPRNLPANPNTTLSKAQCPTDQQLESGEFRDMRHRYRMLVGTYIWLQATVRIDIVHIVLILCSFMSNPGPAHYTAALWTLQYLKSTKDRGITYHMDGEFDLTGYVDADHGSHEDRKSVYSFLFMLAGGPISWKSGFETLVSLSTAESEVRACHALKEPVKHLLYLKKVFESLILPEVAERSKIYLSRLPLCINEDNRAAIRYMINPSGESSMKHIESVIFWLHDHVKSGLIKFVECASADMLADNGTKIQEYGPFTSINDRLMPRDP